MTIFQKILNKEIPATIVYEDDRALAFRDISAQAPTHVLVIPKRAIRSVADMTEADAPLLGHLIWVAHVVAIQEKLTNGYRLVVNTGPDGGQSVDHLHVHLLGGRSLAWPPG